MDVERYEWSSNGSHGDHISSIQRVTSSARKNKDRMESNVEKNDSAEEINLGLNIPLRKRDSSDKAKFS